MIWHAFRGRPIDKKIRGANFELSEKEQVIVERPVHILCGHDDIITCLFMGLHPSGVGLSKLIVLRSMHSLGIVWRAFSSFSFDSINFVNHNYVYVYLIYLVIYTLLELLIKVNLSDPKMLSVKHFFWS
ncbi:hypothetical protein ACJX0J_028024 [Zea mays]